MVNPAALVTPAYLRTMLADAPLDWLALADPSNVAYATGYRSVGGDLFAGHQMIALVSSDEIYLVGSASDAGPATEVAVAPDRYEPFGTFYFESEANPVATMTGRHASAAEALDRLAARVGVAGIIGVDGRIGDAVGPLEVRGSVADAAAWIARLRRRKLPEEVEMLRRVARLTEDAIDVAVAAAGVGVTERELAMTVAATMTAGGADPRFLVVTSGPRTALADARATNRELRPGDLLRFDVGCTLDGYWSDIGRTAVLGEPDALSASRYAAILAGEKAQLEAAAPGVTAGELFRLAVDRVEEAGLKPYRRHHCGHGIGLDVYEQPIVAEGNDTALESGMVFCFETPFYDLDAGGMMVEDAVVITEDGCEVLTTSDRSLRVVPA